MYVEEFEVWMGWQKFVQECPTLETTPKEEHKIESNKERGLVKNNSEATK